MLKACTHLRRLTRIEEQVQDIVAGFAPSVVEALRGNIVSTNRRMLLRLRPQFDVTMMLVWRHVISYLWQHFQMAHIYMLCDSSPTCGMEAFIMVEYLVASEMFTFRRLLPLTYFGLGYMGLTDKLMALLWGIWLEVGDDEILLR